MNRKLFFMLFVTGPLLVLMVVILGIALWPFIFTRDVSARWLVMSDLQNIRNALETYKLDRGHYPTSQEGLAILEKRPPQAEGWHGPYFRGAVPKDPWGHPYLYRLLPTGRFTIASLGADNKPGGDGADADLSLTE